MWFMRPQIHRAELYAWAAFGPIQVIWNRSHGGPLVWLTTNKPKLLFGDFWA